MPTYDFICNSCGKRFDVFLTFSEYGNKEIHCLHCQSANIRRRMTKVRIAKSGGARLESMTDEFMGFEEVQDDPKALGKMMRKMGSEMGDELPEEFNEVVDRLEAGQNYDEIQSALPDGEDETSGG
ncbi:MAG TPA: zinc ribbon domain-containing protein [Anaerolineales bacterium]|nr:zinc ribbon domain-containing protein [Anaerolineales bacterium]HNB35363.1 zinc ribbon domain-containing protein [Anaerolineales bacterium]HNC07723.1 zinc ribbon domain-containing protein [Anaerolineales bacterium]